MSERKFIRKRLNNFKQISSDLDKSIDYLERDFNYLAVSILEAIDTLRDRKIYDISDRLRDALENVGLEVDWELSRESSTIHRLKDL